MNEYKGPQRGVITESSERDEKAQKHFDGIPGSILSSNQEFETRS